jgi:hypothetical protein
MVSSRVGLERSFEIRITNRPPKDRNALGTAEGASASKSKWHSSQLFTTTSWPIRRLTVVAAARRR